MLYHWVRNLSYEKLGAQKRTSRNKVSKFVTEPLYTFWNIKNKVELVMRLAVATQLGFVSLIRDFGLYPKSSGKPLKYFKKEVS